MEGGLVHIGISKGNDSKMAEKKFVHRAAKGKGDTDNLQVHILLPSGSEHEIFHLMKSDKATQHLQFTADWYKP